MSRTEELERLTGFPILRLTLVVYRANARKARFIGVFGSSELNNAALSFTYLVSAALVRKVRPTDLNRNTGASCLRRR
jgi:hypothetical protein